jgi:hypothetical protein
MKDWLGNELEIGGLVLYSSTSTLTGMNLAEILAIPDSGTIQLRIFHVTRRGTVFIRGRKITLKQGSSAFSTVTRYFGKIPREDVIE